MKLLKIGLAVVSLALAGSAYAVELGDDGLHKTEWMRDTFKDLREDLAEANAEGKRLMLTVEQRGCIYCTKMHQEVFPLPNIDAYLKEHYFVVQINMFGDVEVTDFDGESLPEKDMVRKWGMMFTPTLVFLPEDVAEGQTA
ncbi:MAG: thioredoxin-related protein, partial [Akkermansiaceae bacterium]